MRFPCFCVPIYPPNSYFSRNADGTTLRPLISGWQSLTLVLMTGQEWPDAVTAIKNYVLEALNFDFISLASPSCMGIAANFYARLGIMLAVMVLIIGRGWAVSAARFYCGRHRNCRNWVFHGDPAKWQQHKRLRLHDTIIIVLLMYTTLSTMAFYVFRCKNIESEAPGNPDASYLMADYSIDCKDTSGTRTGMQALAAIVLALFSFGTPLLFFVKLWRNRSRLEHDVRPASLRVESYTDDQDFINLWGTLFVM